jgi:hypothetical protein
MPTLLIYDSFKFVLAVHRSNALRWNASCNAPALRNKIREDAGASTPRTPAISRRAQ